MARRGAGRALVLPLVLVLLLGAIAGGSYLALQRFGAPLGQGTCTATGLGTSRSYDPEQTANAALISAIAVDRGLPARAASIALATAFQESKLRNIDYGDRDSLGLFQQRPSQGWGTEQEILDPVYSTNAFYDALVKIPDYENGDINDVAQRVQRSGFPEAYRDHETEGRLFASALTGRSGPNLVCSLAAPSGAGDPQGLTQRLERDYARLTADGRLRATPRGDGTVEISVGGDERLGWSVANWAVAQAADLGITDVSFAGRQWDRSARGDASRQWGTADGADTTTVVVRLAAG
ncbi:hypothetical protein JSY14_10485 [Brachybacterium sp. EF45031]|uniref:hypothetical protein n=1 Tax=Brachybacterium sillae TaxID=2810536 RepID=UPI00217E0F43|nr:hypothetical protein [Brachybacterium sillae]MCS6712433.1 hypothetical protein [Brachybacterium sillae]